MTEEVNQNSEIEQDVQGNSQDTTPEVNEEQGQEEQKEERRFTQTDVNDIISKKIAEERSKSEKSLGDLQQRLERFEHLFNNFGKQPEQPEQPSIDPNKPLTVADYQALVQQQQLQKQAEIASSKINEFMTDAKTKFQDFDTVKEQHKDVFNVLENDEVIANAAVVTGQPFEFAYHVAKSCPDEFKKIANISNPALKFAEIIRLEAKLKQGAKVPNQSGAPAPLQDERGDGGDVDTHDVQAARQRLMAR